MMKWRYSNVLLLFSSFYFWFVCVHNVADRAGSNNKFNNEWQSVESCILTSPSIIIPIVTTEIAIVMNIPTIDILIHLIIDPSTDRIMVLNTWIHRQFIMFLRTISLRPSQFCLKSQHKDYLLKNSKHIQPSTTRIWQILVKKNISITTVRIRFLLSILLETEINETNKFNEKNPSLIFWFIHCLLIYLIHLISNKLIHT